MKSHVLALLLGAGTKTAVAQAFDHSAFDTLLRAHVVRGMVDYDAFQAAPEFRRYLEALAEADLNELGSSERLAFWINAYNAYTIQLINKHSERQSIRNINKTLGLALKGPWHEKLVKAGGVSSHLDHVEHDIIRRQWKEPRFHFALVCADMSCPPLRSEAYTGTRLEAQLLDQARRFLIGAPDRNRLDASTGIVYASPIYAGYYRGDFGGSDEAIGKYLAQFYRDGSAERQLLLSARFKLVETRYDWTLNSQEQARKLAAGGK